MAKQLFKLPGYYKGLIGRRLRQSGRLWLVRVANNPPPYWLVMIRSFHIERDRASGAKSIGVWRFVKEQPAIAKFEELRPLYPPYPIRLPTPAQLAHRAKFAEQKRRKVALQGGNSQ